MSTIITIDGPVATGKSTIARHLAGSIGYIYFDTGAMYRAATLALLREGVSLDDEEALKEALERFERAFDIKIMRGERCYYLGSEDVSREIRLDRVTAAVSSIAAHPLVREKLVAIQRRLAQGVNAVFEGRDMGTVVFPHAQVKVFLTGSAEERAKRRFEELVAKFPEQYKNLNLETVQKEIEERDRDDTTRAISPLQKADDACTIDTTNLTVDEIVYRILEYRDSLKTKLRP